MECDRCRKLPGEFTLGDPSGGLSHRYACCACLVEEVRAWTCEGAGVLVYAGS